MVQLPTPRHLDRATIFGRGKGNPYSENFKLESSSEIPASGARIDGASVDALVKDIPLREAFFYSEAFRQHAHTDDLNDPWHLLEWIFSLHFWPDTNKDALDVLEKLSEESITVLRKIFFESRDAEIRSRLGDILWLLLGDRKARTIAVEAYLESGLRLEDPAHWGRAIWRYKRAAELTLDLRKKSSLRRKVGEFVFDRVCFHEGGRPYYFTKPALEILLMMRTGDPEELYRHASTAAERARAKGDYRYARAYYAMAEKISRSSKSEGGVLAARTAIAEIWVEEAECLDEAGEFLTVRYAWRKAILAYRRLGNEAKASQLRIRLRNAKRISRRYLRSLG